MTDIVHVPELSEFDRLLAHGPYYEKLAWQGALAGGVVSLFAGKSESRGNLGHAVSYAIAGTGLAIGGAFLLFELGKFVSGRSHEAVSGEYMAGYRGGRRGVGRGGFQQQFGQQQFDQQQQFGPPPDQDDQGPPMPMPPPQPQQQWHPHHGRGRW